MNVANITSIASRILCIQAARVWGTQDLDELGTFVAGCGFPLVYQGHQGKKYLFCKVGDMNRPGNEVEIVTTENSIDEEIAEEIRARPLPLGTVVFPKIGGAIATNKRRIIVRNTMIDNNVMGITPHSGTDAKWLYYLLKGMDFAKYQTGTSVPALRKTVIGEIKVPRIPLNVQFQIVLFLDWLSSRAPNVSWNEAPQLPPDFSEQRRIVERIEELAKRIEEAKALRKQGTEETEGIVASASERLFEPKPDWKTMAVGDFCEPPQYRYTESATDQPVGPRFLRITDIQGGNVDWEQVPYCRCSDTPKYLLKPNDLVFARTGATTGKSFVVRDCPEAVFASYLIRLRVRDTVSVDYLYRYFQSPSYWRQIADEKKGTGQPNLNGSKLERLMVPVAPLPDQRRIVAYLDALQSEVDALKRLQAETAAELDALLPSILDKAFKGEL